MRKFEKVCEDIFIRDVPDGIYNDIILPKRSTSFSAGYDFYSVISFSLNPGERKIIPTGIKVVMNNNEFLGIFVRSSLGFKYNVRMCNQVELLMLIIIIIKIMMDIFLFVYRMKEIRL